MRIKILYWLGWLLTRCISVVFFRIKIQGTENIPRTGGFIVACNHQAYADPPLVGSAMLRETCFFAKSELFHSFWFGALLRRVNALPVRRGTIDRQAISISVEKIRNGLGLVVFPEGTRSRTGEFLSALPGVGLIAMRAGCPVVPAYLHGSNRLKSCLLGRERLIIRFSEPFSAEWVRSLPAGRAGYQQVADSVMGRIAELRKKVIGVKAN